MEIEMKKYPYIGINKHGQKGLIYGYGEGVYADGCKSPAVTGGKIAPYFAKPSRYTNITREHLSNTWGVVESKEHAEFIIGLAKGCDFDIFGLVNIKSAKSFKFKGGHLLVFKHEIQDTEGLKQITIPLPLKSSVSKDNRDIERDVAPTATKEEEFEMTQIEKNNGDNLMFGGADKCKEWPCVGDKFIHKGELVTCISKGIISDGSEVITFEGADKLSHGSCWNNDSWVQKPKTQEEELRDDLMELTLKHMENNSHPAEANAYYLFGELMSKYNITKKPQ